MDGFHEILGRVRPLVRKESIYFGGQPDLDPEIVIINYNHFNLLIRFAHIVSCYL